MSRRIVIFDIDGTLALLDHRLHLVRNGNRRWDEFFAKCGDDLPCQDIIDLNRFLIKDPNIITILVSGRSDVVQQETIDWLRKHGVVYDELYMRKHGDYRKDFVIKKEILSEIKAKWIDCEVWFVVDDRPSVVAMWRAEGITCLQCAEWDEKKAQSQQSQEKGLLTLMVGPTGSGKSTWLQSERATLLGHHVSHVVSSDQIRQDICGNFLEQSRNDEVFRILHAVVKVRIDNGLPTIVDATNIKRADRISIVNLAEGGRVTYVVIDRPMEDKRKTGGWRNELNFDLLEKHDQTFRSQLKDILSGDNLKNVTVMDERI